jgi:hypothetical protein
VRKWGIWMTMTAPVDTTVLLSPTGPFPQYPIPKHRPGVLSANELLDFPKRRLRPSHDALRVVRRHHHQDYPAI